MFLLCTPCMQRPFRTVESLRQRDSGKLGKQGGAKGNHPSCRAWGRLNPLFPPRLSNFWHLWAKLFSPVNRFNLGLGLALITINFNLILFKACTFIDSWNNRNLFTLITQIRRRAVPTNTRSLSQQKEIDTANSFEFCYFDYQSRIDVFCTTSIALWPSVVWTPSYFWHFTDVGATCISIR